MLTGEAKGENYPEGQRITALMVNNLVDARPQRGLSKAQMLFEIKVEGGITRFMPVFNDYHDIDEIGPIRSGRDQFFQLILPWQACISTKASLLSCSSTPWIMITAC